MGISPPDLNSYLWPKKSRSVAIYRERSLAACRGDRRGHCLATGGVAPGDRHVRAIAGERLRDGPTDARGSAGGQRRLSCQTHDPLLALATVSRRSLHWTD